MKYEFKTKQEGINYFKDLGYEIKEGPNWFIVIPKQEELEEIHVSYKKKYVNKICNICKSKYIGTAPRQIICKCCKLFVTCKQCGNYFHKEIITLDIIDDIKNNRILNLFCSNAHASQFTIKIAKEAEMKLYQTNEEWSKNRRQISADIGKKMGPKNIKYANAYCDKHPEIRINNGKKNIIKALEKNKYLRENDLEWANKEKERIAELGKKTGKINIKYAHKRTQELRENNFEYSEREKENAKQMGLKYGAKNLNEFRTNYPEEALQNSLKALEKANEIRTWLWENDSEWAFNMSKISSENIEIARKERINKIKEEISKLQLIITQNSIDVSNIQQLRKNDICGTYVIRAKFKDYKETERENQVFNLLTCKSKYIYDEIYWILRVLSKPEKQNGIISEENPWNIAKWWYISNLYYDFEFVLLTDFNGVSEEEALLTEAKYALDNNMQVEFLEDEEGNRIPNIKKHAYWSL